VAALVPHAEIEGEMGEPQMGSAILVMLCSEGVA
jgi:RecA/RadA recombinase